MNFLSKKMVVVQAVLAVFCMVAFSVAAQSHEATIEWTLPTHTVMNGLCDQAGFPIPVDKSLGVTVRYKVQGAAVWNEVEAGVGATSFTITGLAPETTYEISVGPHYVGDPVLCFSPVIFATTPSLEPPQGCSDVTVTNIK